MELNEMDIRALRYVVNTGGGATRAHFFEDHEPVGERIWLKFVTMGLVRTDETGRIFLTDKGASSLASA